MGWHKIMLRSILLLTSMLWLSSCSTLSVSYDYNPDIDFRQLKTYDWIAFPEDIPVNELDRARFIKAVEANLTGKGLTKNAADPDFLIATHFGTESRIDITNWGYSYAPNTYYTGHGYGHHGYGHDGGYATTGGVNVYEYEQGTLILDFIDTDNKKLMWRATAKAIISPASTPQKQTEKINSGVQEILSSFPPPSEPISNAEIDG
ncbi:hypothetical protein MNBD_GAMMA10-2331 [hydrothermal vent metagenome]|uniref:DUF4136 domain-containing protein n=1 Tax=hydrothermal vent metagenome TaxID=652676 RepID=A0A3B0XX11_9ZZZZ